jgi:hypothetical protein
MISLLLALAAAVDGEAALRHAKALAALGPHPFGSPRGAAAAQYVAAQFREAGLDEVRLLPVESGGLHGANVVGVLRGPGTDILVLAAHHDSPAESPGAHPAGGVATLVEAARALVRRGPRGRTIAFVSFDGEEAPARDSLARSTAGVGSRAWVQSLGSDARNVVALVALAGSGWKEGAAVLSAPAHAHELTSFVVAPAGVVRAVLDGARGASRPLAVGEPLVPWLYQPAVRFFRAADRGSDAAPLRAGVPAVALSDEPFLVRYPFAGQAADTADKLDPDALARVGDALLGAAAVVETIPRPAADPDWLVVAGRVLDRSTLLAIGALSLVPGFLGALRGGSLALGVRVAQAALFGVMLVRLPVPTLAIFLLANLVTPVARGRVASLFAVIPPLALAAYGGLAWSRGLVAGVWPAAWELAVLGFAFALLWLRPGGRLGRAPIRSRRRGAPRR